MQVDGWGANQERKNKFGLPDDWSDPHGESRPDGGFSIVFDPPRAYQFTLDDGSTVEVKGNEEIEYDGELHTAANLFDALKEGYYGKF